MSTFSFSTKPTGYPQVPKGIECDTVTHSNQKLLDVSTPVTHDGRMPNPKYTYTKKTLCLSLKISNARVTVSRNGRIPNLENAYTKKIQCL